MLDPFSIGSSWLQQQILVLCRLSVATYVVCVRFGRNCPGPKLYQQCIAVARQYGLVGQVVQCIGESQVVVACQYGFDDGQGVER